MKIYKDMKSKRVEKKLSEFSALLSLATDDIYKVKDITDDVEKQLKHMQEEIENLYIVLDEPILVAIDTPKNNRQKNNGVQNTTKREKIK